MTETGGPLHPMTPFLFVNGEVTQEAYNAIANAIASNAQTGATRIDFFANSAMQTLLADADESTDLEKLVAKAFKIGELMLKQSMAIAGNESQMRTRLAQLENERKGLITNLHDLKERLARFSKSTEIQTREVLDAQASKTEDD